MKVKNKSKNTDLCLSNVWELVMYVFLNLVWKLVRVETSVSLNGVDDMCFNCFVRLKLISEEYIVKNEMVQKGNMSKWKSIYQ